MTPTIQVVRPKAVLAETRRARSTVARPLAVISNLAVVPEAVRVDGRWFGPVTWGEARLLDRLVETAGEDVCG